MSSSVWKGIYIYVLRENLQTCSLKVIHHVFLFIEILLTDVVFEFEVLQPYNSTTYILQQNLEVTEWDWITK